MPGIRKKIYLKFIYVAGVILTAILLLLCFWFLRPYDNISNSPFQTDKKQYKHGEIVKLSNTFCWDGTPFRADRFFLSRTTKISNGTVEFPFGWANSPVLAEKYKKNPCNPTTVTVEIPNSLPVGLWSVVYETSYKANPVRTVSFDTQSNVFEVVEEDGA